MCSYNQIQREVLVKLRHYNICKTKYKKTKREKRGGKQKIKPVISQRLCCPLSSDVHRDVNKRTLTYIDTTSIEYTDFSNLKISYLNTQSARLKGSLLNDLITYSNSDLFFFTETWFRSEGDEVLINELRPPGFAKPISVPREGRTGGGLCLVYKQSILVTKTVLSQFRSFEACEFRTKSDNKVTKFICIYRPPPSKTNKLKPNMFIREFCDLLDMYIITKDHLVILGDFNLHHDSEDEYYARSMKTCLQNRNLVQLVNKPTQISNHILDWVVVREDDNLVQNLEVSDKCLSDHFVISFNINISKPPSIKRSVASRDLKRLNKNSLSSDIASLALPQSDDVNVLTKNLNTKLSAILDQHAPLRVRRVSSRKAAPWITPAVKQVKRERRQAERKWRKTKSETDRTAYKLKHSELQYVIANEKRSYCISKINECTSSKALYSLTNELSGKSYDSILPNNIPKEDLPNEFCKYFNEKVENIRKDLDNQNIASFINESALDSLRA